MDGYDLVDVGDGGRLERFAGLLVDRPAPGAVGARRDDAAWRRADLRFDRARGWSGPAAGDRRVVEDWRLTVDDIQLGLRPTEAGQVGLFPEHLAMVGWLGARAGGSADAREPSGDPSTGVLNLFAYTGLATLALAQAGFAVTHVDSSKSAVAWARRNAVGSGLSARPVRWIVDDARRFVEREARRGRRYRGVVLDPPSYGHGTGGHAWRIGGDLEPLLAAVREVLAPDAFVLLTAHTPELGAERLGSALATALRRPMGAMEAGELAVATTDGRRLDLGAFARTDGSA